MVLASLLLLSLSDESGLILFSLSFSFAPAFLSFAINDFNFFKALFIISRSFSEYILLCKTWSNFAAIVIRISGIPSSLSSRALLLLSDSASVNKLNINVFRDHQYQFLGVYCLLLLILVYVHAFMFMPKSFSSSELFNILLLAILFFLFLSNLFLAINFY